MNKLITLEKYRPAYNYIKEKIHVIPQVAVILGSGLGGFADCLENKTIIPTTNIPGYPESTVPGHSGKLIFGYSDSNPALVFQGRIHYYEGYELSDVIFPEMLSYLLEIKKIIITNVSGGINFKPGDICIIENHINLTLKNPARYLDFIKKSVYYQNLKSPYDPEMIKLAEKTGIESNILLQKGTYLWTLGPSYETPSEIQAAKIMGADMVGMSTVPEVIVAGLLGMRVLGLSLISNYACGIVKQKLVHEEVLEIGERYKPKLNLILQKIIKSILSNVE